MTTAFESSEYDLAYPDGYTEHFWHLARDRILCEAMRRHVAPGSRTMEIGCGRAHFVARLREAGYAAHGVELGRPRVLAEAAPFVATGISFADLPAASRAGTACVLLLDVIEHIEDAPAFLAGVAGRFPDLETLVVTVPARPEIWSNYDGHYGHFRRYTTATLQAHVGAAGFRPLETRYFFRALYLAALALKAAGARREIVHEAPRGGPTHKAIAGALLGETWLLPWCVPGSSLLCVARRARPTSA